MAYVEKTEKEILEELDFGGYYEAIFLIKQQKKSISNLKRRLTNLNKKEQGSELPPDESQQRPITD